MTRMISIPLYGLFLVFLLSCASKNQLAEWSAQTSYRQYIPVAITLPISWESGMVLHDESGRFLAHLQEIDEKHALLVPNRNIERDETLVLTKGQTPTTENACHISRENGRIIARWKDQEILTYAIDPQLPSDTLPPYYRRSGFIHPVKTGNGNTITDGFPRGHSHQHGVFNAWTRSHFRGEMIDFWNQQSQLGSVRHVDVLDIENGPVFSSFTVSLQPIAYLADDTIAGLEETWTVRLIPMHKNYLIDWSIEQRGNGTDSLIIDEYHYGGAAFRGSAHWNIEGGAYDSLVYFTTNDHQSNLEANHARPLWTALYGRVPESYAGMAMMGHPTNFRHPQPIRVHPTMPYLCYAPMVLGSFSIAPDGIYKSRYAIYVYDGRPDADQITHIQKAFHLF